MRLVFDTQNLNYWSNYTKDEETIEQMEAKVVGKLDDLKNFITVPHGELLSTEEAEVRKQKISDLLMTLFEYVDFKSITEVTIKRTMEDILKTKALEDEIDERQLQLTEEQTNEIVDMFLKMKA